MAGKVRTVEQIAAAIAREGWGTVSRPELLGAGITPAQIDRRLECGYLIVEFQGVYRVGHCAPSVEAHYAAAVKACGSQAVLSGMAAGFHWRLLKGTPPPPEITATTERRIPGIRAHRARHGLDPRDRTEFCGIPVTTVARTLVDLAAELNGSQLARACHEAGVLYRTTPAEVETVLARRTRAPGARRLRAVLRGETQVSLSRLESAFVAHLRREELALPITNRLAGGRRVDCRWPDHRLTVELDGYRFHNSRHAWERDRKRERAAYARGDEFRRYTSGDVFDDPRPMLRELRALLCDKRRHP